jgi:hypothetical protein
MQPHPPLDDLRECGHESSHACFRLAMQKSTARNPGQPEVLPRESPRPGAHAPATVEQGTWNPGRGFPCPTLRRSGMVAFPAFRFVLAGWRSRAGRCGSPAVSRYVTSRSRRAGSSRSPAPRGHDLRPSLGADHSPGRATGGRGAGLDPEGRAPPGQAQWPVSSRSTLATPSTTSESGPGGDHRRGPGALRGPMAQAAGNRLKKTPVPCASWVSWVRARADHQCCSRDARHPNPGTSAPWDFWIVSLAAVMGPNRDPGSTPPRLRRPPRAN